VRKIFTSAQEHEKVVTMRKQKGIEVGDNMVRDPTSTDIWGSFMV